VARTKQEILQVLTWMDRMEQLQPSLPSFEEKASALLVMVVGQHGEGKEEEEEENAVRQQVRQACANGFLQEVEEREKKQKRNSGRSTGDRDRQRVEEALVAFARDDERQRTQFSRSALSSFERYVVYETSERLGLTHRKVGDAIVVSKLKFELRPLGGKHHDHGHDDDDDDDNAQEEENKSAMGEARASLERCQVLEECLTVSLLDLDSLSNSEEMIPRDERKNLVHICQTLLAVLEAWKAHLQQQLLLMQSDPATDNQLAVLPRS